MHSHDGDAHDHSHDGVYVEEYTWKMLVMMCAVWLFFMLQLGMEALTASREEKVSTVAEMQYKKKVGTMSQEANEWIYNCITFSVGCHCDK